MVLAMVLAVSKVVLVRGIAQPRPDCLRSCGNVTIPFPFGSSPDCYLDDSFIIICNNTYNPPIPFLIGNIEVFDISLDGHLKVSTKMAYDCYNDSGSSTIDVYSWLRLVNFSISATRNKFTTIGCDTYSFVEGSRGKNYTTGCTALCYGLDYVQNGSCNGIGCCEMMIPNGVRDFQLTVNSYRNHTRVQKFNPCGYAFVAEEGYYNFSSTDLWDLQFQTHGKFPVVLQWSVGNQSCQVAEKNKSTYACRSEYSECINSFTGKGYQCNCTSGFQGNAYLIDGCKGTECFLIIFPIKFLFLIITFFYIYIEDIRKECPPVSYNFLTWGGFLFCLNSNVTFNSFTNLKLSKHNGI